MKAPSSNARAGLAIVLLAAIFTYGLIRAFSIRFATGDVYPEYSSMKATPDGAKLLYESLAHTPGMIVSRNFSALEYSDESHAAYLFLAINPLLLPSMYLDPLEHLADRGNRVVIALNWDSPKSPDVPGEIDKRWHVKLGFDNNHRVLYISSAPDWRVLRRSGDEILAIERNFGKGSVVLFARSGEFSNESIAGLEHLDDISAALGGANRVIFDEQHFGIAESGTVVGLARRFRLIGMAAGFALCAALFIWKNGSGFPPPAPAARRDTISGRTSLSGLQTLLHRHIQPADLAAACWNEWLVGNGRDVSPERRARAEQILRERGRDPLAAVREIQTVLHAKGPL
jgi:hypothetical protein